MKLRRLIKSLEGIGAAGLIIAFGLAVIAAATYLIYKTIAGL